MCDVTVILKMMSTNVSEMFQPHKQKGIPVRTNLPIRASFRKLLKTATPAAQQLLNMGIETQEINSRNRRQYGQVVLHYQQYVNQVVQFTQECIYMLEQTR